MECEREEGRGEGGGVWMRGVNEEGKLTLRFGQKRLKQFFFKISINMSCNLS
jgi:hypothetical protein